MCGVTGRLSTKENVIQSLIASLNTIQHRGQDSAGIATYKDHKFLLRKNNGLVREVFRENHVRKLQGRVGVGHVRYTTQGSASSVEEAQPFFCNSPFGIAMVHNGNIINSDELEELIWHKDLRHLNTASDSELLLNVFAHELHKAYQETPDIQQAYLEAVRMVHDRVDGAYAAVGFIVGHGLFAFRDPLAIRPLCFGLSGDGSEYMVASESVALQTQGYEEIHDLGPGEAIFIDEQGVMIRAGCAEKPILSPCIFEYVYLARPDSKIDEVSVYKSRLRMADKLGDKILRDWGPEPHDIDVVIPIPETSRACAIPLAHNLGVKYREGFFKDRFVGRTFIMPDQPKRKKSIREKLNAIDLEFSGKNVLLVDDSIVRGNTAQEVIQMARDCGAKKVYFASAAPPIRHQNIYGIDMPTTKELVAFDRTEDEVCEYIGADRLFYQDLDDLREAVREGNLGIPTFDVSCFNGIYPTGVRAEYLAALEASR
jgi:amidophosphoribosyltransferase